MTVGILLEKEVHPKGFFIKFLSFQTFLIVYVLCAFVVTASFKGKLLASLVRVDLEPRIDTSEVKGTC